MNPADFRVRRATLDDVGALMQLWQSMHFRTEDLARRITEFQVVEGGDGKVLGGVGLQMAQKQGLIHSEAFLDFAHAEHLRPALWERLNAVAANHGLLRLWTREQAPFWNHIGLSKPDSEALEKLPLAWRDANSKWLTLKLKDDAQEILSADKEFAVFMQAEKERTQRALQQAKVLKFIAMFLAFGIFLLIIVGAFLMIKKNPQILHPR